MPRILIALCAFVVPAAAQQRQQVQYPTPYYIISTDADMDVVRELAVRVTAVAEVYYERTKSFAGVIRTRFPLYVYTNAADYHEAGGPEGSAGCYSHRGRSGRLMAIAQPGREKFLWHVLQHEGFHQFAHMVITEHLPIWVNEGMAEYFGIGIWTGDGLVTGVVPPDRLKTIQRLIQDKSLLSFEQMLSMSREQWNAAIGGDSAWRNYIQAWSMVQFLVHADDGQYQKAFGNFICDLAHRVNWKTAWSNRIGHDIEGFEKRYAEWWLAQSEDCSRDLHVQATVQTLGSYLRRAKLQRLKFQTASDFFAAAREGRIKPLDDINEWLPADMLLECTSAAMLLGKWSLEAPRGKPTTLTLTTHDGKTYCATIAMQSKLRCNRVLVQCSNASGPEKSSDKSTSGTTDSSRPGRQAR